MARGTRNVGLAAGIHRIGFRKSAHSDGAFFIPGRAAMERCLAEL